MIGTARREGADSAAGVPLIDETMATPDIAQTPPQNLEAEESALGAMMVSKGAIDAVILDYRLTEDDFYREGHRIVYRAIKSLYERNDPVDSISVDEILSSLLGYGEGKIRELEKTGKIVCWRG